MAAPDVISELNESLSVYVLFGLAMKNGVGIAALI